MHADPLTTPSSAIIAPNIIRYLLRVAEERGVSLERALLAASLTRQTVDSPTLRVSYRQGRTIIEQALAAIDSPALGVEVGRRQPITASGVLGLAMLTSATLHDAVLMGVRYQNLAGSMVRWAAGYESDSLVVTATVPEAGSPVGRFLVEEGFANITRMARDSAGLTEPRRIEFTFNEAGGREAHAAYFACALSYGARRNSWQLPAALAEAALPTADPWALREASQLLEAQTGNVVARQELVAVLAAHIEDALPAVHPLSVYARTLALSERTLRRRLIEVGSSYSPVLDDVRRRLAEELLANPVLSLPEVSFRLGYSDERSLRRSTLRWFGASPSEARLKAQTPR